MPNTVGLVLKHGVRYGIFKREYTKVDDHSN